MSHLKNFIPCCEELTAQIEEDYMFDISGSTLRILSDGGHGGIVDANYCPFCGTKTRFTDLQPELP